jgi:DNA repair protein RadC
VSLTRHLQQALALIDVQLLDHLVVTRSSHISLKAKGLF